MIAAPELPYSHDALEPHISANTLSFHLISTTWAITRNFWRPLKAQSMPNPAWKISLPLGQQTYLTMRRKLGTIPFTGTP